MIDLRRIVAVSCSLGCAALACAGGTGSLSFGSLHSGTDSGYDVPESQGIYVGDYNMIYTPTGGMADDFVGYCTDFDIINKSPFASTLTTTASGQYTGTVTGPNGNVSTENEEVAYIDIHYGAATSDVAAIATQLAIWDATSDEYLTYSTIHVPYSEATAAFDAADAEYTAALEYANSSDVVTFYQATPDTGSQSFVSIPAVPEPFTMALAIGGLGLAARRRFVSRPA